MGFMPPASFPVQGTSLSRSPSVPSSTSAQGPVSQGTVVTAPPAREKATSVNPAQTRPNAVASAAIDIATGNVVGIFSELEHLLRGD
jgi:hypothetical protein